ncbi:alpha-ribazole phosphatase [Chryseobacterium indologenes]|uniref:Alpha-ribazole phosphatase n=1 Tax=Chryseobacterium indologenes TaxID=253 RepID=A0A0N0IYG2_CHRID|nr:alpha-ribazole phosphatase [Chryseobacterium indologenes]KPE53084.1 hypothetical protein AOB46_03615 [Chryseobacterium indologenes]
MEIHLIRHTAVENPSGLCYGFAEMPLKEDYIKDFTILNLERDFNRVISSPSRRCTFLAEYIQLNYATDERLREMNFGNWEMKPWAEIPEEEINPWYEDFIHVKASEGENLLEMRARVINFWKELTATENGDKILLVTHAGVIRLILQTVLQFPLENMFKLHIGYGKRTVIELKEGYFSVKEMNL